MSAQPAQEPPIDPLGVDEKDIDAVLYEAKGDAREAIRMLLRDLAVMAMDGDGATSRGFLRGRFSEGARRPPWIEEP
ncbi:MAG: hypothetical protein O9288_17395 [Novosphingobium sp.]|uniref:hypothetical protein n=1 Tax=Novosphingobium sp. TaxID=1874826 RepID=UPI0022C71F70|nr:hypothetical protein [Novosphingobium sp.]MCZ8036506.1 hypothetical protein [Novosphingobium sp.]